MSRDVYDSMIEFMYQMHGNPGHNDEKMAEQVFDLYVGHFEVELEEFKRRLILYKMGL